MNPITDNYNDIIDLYDLADIDSHLKFLNKMLTHHHWQEGKKIKFEQEIRFIEQRKEDKNLYLSIIGEFTSGKSTFINALLRDNLLETDILQGTTVASTSIRYGSKHSICVNYKDRIQETIKLEDIPDQNYDVFRKYLRGLSIDEAKAKTIEEIIVEHPAAILRNGFIIIDTPGTNSIERWHEEVTKNTIRTISDISVILTTADQPLPESLITFIENNLDDVLNRCIFVVTKMDLLREKEIKRQLTYVEQKIQNTFGIVNPIVLPYTPLLVLCEADEKVKCETNYSKNNYNNLISESYRTEATIFSEIHEKRIIIQMQKLLNIMEELMTCISEEMKVMTSANNKKHALLLAEKKDDLEKFTTEKKQEHLKSFNIKAAEIKQKSINELYQFIENQKKEIYKSVEKCNNKQKLYQFFKKKL